MRIGCALFLRHTQSIVKGGRSHLNHADFALNRTGNCLILSASHASF